MIHLLMILASGALLGLLLSWPIGKPEPPWPCLDCLDGEHETCASDEYPAGCCCGAVPAIALADAPVFCDWGDE